jgi:hypothetical protein
MEGGAIVTSFISRFRMSSFVNDVAVSWNSHLQHGLQEEFSWRLKTFHFCAYSPWSCWVLRSDRW